MVKIPTAKARGALDRPDPAVRFYLLTGSDSSASRLHADRLRKSLDAEKMALTGAQLKSDPRLLVDEVSSLPMFGGRRLMWIEPCGEESLPAIEAMLDLAVVEAVTVAILATAPKKDSGLAKLADRHPHAVHIQSEPLSGREQVAAVMELANGEGLRVPPPLAERIAAEANGDLMLARLELQKFALFVGASADRPQALEDEVVDALGIDQAETDSGRPGDLALAGDLAGLADELAAIEAGGIEPIPVVRALQRRLLMLAPLRARADGGQSLDAIMRMVWKRDQAKVSRMLPRWSASGLAEALERVQRLERQLLFTPASAHPALGETLLRLARAARR